MYRKPLNGPGQRCADRGGGTCGLTEGVLAPPCLSGQRVMKSLRGHILLLFRGPDSIKTAFGVNLPLYVWTCGLYLGLCSGTPGPPL